MAIYTILSRIYALLSVKFSGLKMCECEKSDKYEVCMYNSALQVFIAGQVKTLDGWHPQDDAVWPA